MRVQRGKGSGEQGLGGGGGGIESAACKFVLLSFSSYMVPGLSLLSFP